MRHEIAVSVKNKIAAAEKDALYICGNSDFVIVFDLDEEWAKHETKTARFTYDGGHQDVIFDGNECPVPIISRTFFFGVGIFAGNLETSTPARVPCKKSILCGDGPPHDPPPDVYAQLMEKLSGRVPANQGAENAGKLLYIRADGLLVPLTLGDGLEIIDGMLRITAAITPETPIVFDDGSGGVAVLTGAEFVEQKDGEVLMSGASFTDQGDGVVLIE